MRSPIAEELVELVRDVDDRDAARLEVADDAEEALDLRWLSAEVGSSMMSTRTSLGERLGDLHDLLLAEAQVADELVGVDVLLESRQQLDRLALPLRPAVDGHGLAPPPAPGRGCRATVRLGQRLSSWKMIPMPWRVASVMSAQDDGLPIDQDAAAGRLLDAREDLHQRGLARAVLTDEHVDLARDDVEVTSSSAVVPGKTFVTCSARMVTRTAGVAVATRASASALTAPRPRWARWSAR